MKLQKTVGALLLAALLLAALPACEQRVEQAEETSSGDTQPEPAPAPEPQPEEDPEGADADADDARALVESFLEALASADPSRIGEYVDYSDLLQLESGQSDDSPRAILGHLRYEVVDANTEGGGADVTVRLTNINMTVVLPIFLQRAKAMESNNAVSDNPQGEDAMEAQYAQLFVDTLRENAATTTETVVVLKLTREDGRWSIPVADSLRNAATGDYFTARSRGINAGGGQS